MLFTINDTITVTFSCKSNANADDSKEYTINVDMTGLESEDLLEWACNNGIIVYLQGRIRAGKLFDGDTVTLHKPGTRAASVPVSDEEVATFKPMLLTAGLVAVDTPETEIISIIRAMKKQAMKIPPRKVPEDV